MITERLENNQTAHAADILKSGGLVALPTETVYGLFADALNEDAVRQVFAVKNRSLDHSLNLNISSIEDIYKYSQNQPSYLDRIVEKFMPGPLTIILEANDKVPSYINEGKKTVGFRMPANPFTLNVIKKVGVLVGPSANITGQSSPTKAKQVLRDFDKKINAVKEDDSGISGVDSTIVDFSGEKPIILRQGAVMLESIEELL
ncbi:L-threonylcarbamoyladenylate synthase [Floricoccus tropicus]|uniref:L-threonylcarbamoyladenylate synthase n=1 Tax=Floricoccus tropicus TaxID=1859473 RepID=UPI001E60E937|nr:L-threonylcarbamoyladenylate synthase [Floricoccus tropicus]